MEATSFFAPGQWGQTGEKYTSILTNQAHSKGMTIGENKKRVPGVRLI